MTEKPPIATFSIQNERRVRRFDLDEQCVLSPELVFIVKKFDASKYELFELEKVAVKELTFEEQEKFYMFGETEDSTESSEGSSSNVEW